MKGHVGQQGVVVKRLSVWLRLTNLDGARYDDTRATIKHLRCTYCDCKVAYTLCNLNIYGERYIQIEYVMTIGSKKNVTGKQSIN